MSLLHRVPRRTASISPTTSFLPYSRRTLSVSKTQTNTPHLRVDEVYSDLHNAGSMSDNIAIDASSFRSMLQTDLHVTFSKLTFTQKQQLTTEGFTIIDNALSPHELTAVQQAYDNLVQIEGERAGYEAHTESGSVRLGDLVNKADGLFDKLWLDPLLLECVAYILGEFKLNSLNGRHPLQWYGLQSLHSDTAYLDVLEWDVDAVQMGSTDPWVVANALWMLDDMTVDNGATRVVPGSHLSGKHPSKMLEDPREPHEDEIVVQAPAGSLLVFNAHLWHGGTVNTSGRLRRTVHSYWVKRCWAQQTNQTHFFRAERRRESPKMYRHLS